MALLTVISIIFKKFLLKIWLKGGFYSNRYNFV